MNKQEIYKYYRLNKILSYNAKYNIIVGERSNGKTYSVLEKGIDDYISSKGQLAYIRRWTEDIKPSRIKNLFSSFYMKDNNVIAKKTRGEWTDIIYQNKAFYFARYENDIKIMDTTPFCLIFSLSDSEHDKSESTPNVINILFDEFITRTYYLPDEFVVFMNILSTIIRLRNNVTIFMCGNTVSKMCPYFQEMGLKHIKDMTQGQIDLYRYGDSDLTVAVEYCKPNDKGKKSDVYFSFDNPKLNMIKSGDWELGLYPHAPCKWDKSQVIFTYFINFELRLLQCDIICNNDGYTFTYIHDKTTPLQNTKTDLIFQIDLVSQNNYVQNILKPERKITQRIYDMFKYNHVFYQNNEVGEHVYNYIKWCNQNK